jgi:hypothetical protein
LAPYRTRVLAFDIEDRN